MDGHLSVDMGDLQHPGEGEWGMETGYIQSSHEVQSWDDLKSDLTSEGDSWIVVSDDERDTPEKSNTPTRQNFREQYAYGSAADQLPFAPASPVDDMGSESLLDPRPSEAGDDLPLELSSMAASAESSEPVMCASHESLESTTSSEVMVGQAGKSSAAGSTTSALDAACTDGSAELWEAVVATDADATHAAAAELEKTSPPPITTTEGLDESNVSTPGKVELLLDGVKEDKQLTQLLWDAAPPCGSAGTGDDKPASFIERVRRRVEDIYDRHRHNLLPVVAAHVASFLIGLYIGRKSIAFAAASSARSSPKIL